MKPPITKDELRSLPTMTLSEVEEGDLLFFASDGGLQRFCKLIGELWVHVAVAVRHGGQLRTAEVGIPESVCSRELPRLLDDYATVAVGRPTLAEACRQTAIDRAVNDIRIDIPNDYPWDDVWTAAMVLVTRKSFPAQHLENLDRAVQVLSERFDDKPNARTCAFYIAELFSGAGPECRLTVPITPPPTPRMLKPPGIPDRPSLDDLNGLDERQRTWVLQHNSLLELTRVELELGGGNRPTSRPPIEPSGIGNSWTSGPQFATFIRRLCVFADAIVNDRSGSGSGGGLDDRWVSPTDLWLSPQIGLQAIVQPSRP